MAVRYLSVCFSKEVRIRDDKEMQMIRDADDKEPSALECASVHTCGFFPARQEGSPGHVLMFSSCTFFSGRGDGIGELHLLEKMKRIQTTISLAK